MNLRCPNLHRWTDARVRSQRAMCDGVVDPDMDQIDATATAEHGADVVADDHESIDVKSPKNEEVPTSAFATVEDHEISGYDFFLRRFDSQCGVLWFSFRINSASIKSIDGRVAGSYQ